MKTGLAIILLIIVITAYFYWPMWPSWFLFRFLKNESYKKNIDLRLENESLKAQLLELQLNLNKRPLDDDGHKYLNVKVYSTYPFNDKNIFTIAAGAKDGIEKGMTVLAAKNIIFGKIIKVFNHYSEVETILSPNWQSTVRVGEENFDGLLIGGPLPKVTMIVDSKNVISGQKIYNTYKDFPYGFKIGEVKMVENNNGVFKEVTVSLPYDLNQLLEVIVLTSF